MTACSFSGAALPHLAFLTSQPSRQSLAGTFQVLTQSGTLLGHSALASDILAPRYRRVHKKFVSVALFEGTAFPFSV